MGKIRNWEKSVHQYNDEPDIVIYINDSNGGRIMLMFKKPNWLVIISRRNVWGTKRFEFEHKIQAIDYIIGYMRDNS